MKKNFFIILAITGLAIFSCQQHLSEYQLNEINNRLLGLQGTWSTRLSDGYIEKWKTSGDTLLVGGGYLKIDNSLRQTEALAITNTDGNFSYLATVAGQNQDRTIEFPLAMHTDSSIVFINRNHDFPNVIAYYFIDDSTIRVEVKSLTDPVRDFVLNLKKQNGDLQ